MHPLSESTAAVRQIERKGSVISILAFDTGKHTAWAHLVELPGGAVKYVDSDTIDTPTLPSKNIELLIDAFTGNTVACETPTGGTTFGIKTAKDVRRALAKTPNLIHASAVANRIIGYASRSYVTLEAPAMKWRKHVVGKPNPKDREIERVLRLCVNDFPAKYKTNSHERDAIGVGVWAIRQQRLIARALAPGALLGF